MADVRRQAFAGKKHGEGMNVPVFLPCTDVYRLKSEPYFTCSANQENTVRHHSRAFCGFCTKWFSSGK